MTLNQQIRHFYDTSTKLWLDTWGEHMHHGHYGENGKEKKDPQQAQTDLVNKLLSWGDVQEASRVLDAGCGVGGSARYLAKLFGAKVKGLTLSPVQAAAAKVTRRFAMQLPAAPTPGKITLSAAAMTAGSAVICEA